MQAQELIKELQKHDPEAEVILAMGAAIHDGLSDDCRVKSVEKRIGYPFLPMENAIFLGNGLGLEVPNRPLIYENVIYIFPRLYEDEE